MIVEHDLIEQIADEPHGRSLAWCTELLGQFGAREPWITIRQMYRAGHLRFTHADGTVLQPWQAEQVWRAGEPREDIAVHATDLACRFVDGT